MASLVFSNISFVDAKTSVSSSAIKKKIINVVYDDSQSMVFNEANEYLMNWSQAKYALEVFTSLMGSEDKMNIFPLTGGKILLSGTDTPSDRLSKIRNWNKSPGGTRYSVLLDAEKNLESNNFDDSYDKWLVILTDGRFTENNTGKSKDTNAIYDDFLKWHAHSDIKTVFLGIGADSILMPKSVENEIYTFKANDGMEILSRITEIGKLIFQRLSLPEKFISISGNEYTFNIDVPIENLIVFAQGKDIVLSQLSIDGAPVNQNSVINVKYSDSKPVKDTIEDEKVLTDTSLNGVISTYANINGTEPMKNGQYKITCTGTSNINMQVYYKPAVDLDIKLTQDGKEYSDKDKLFSGDYGIKVSMLNPLTNEPIKSELIDNNPKILAEALYSDGISNNLDSQSGLIRLEKGTANLSVLAYVTDLYYENVNKTLNILNAPKTIQVEIGKPTGEFDIKKLNESLDYLPISAKVQDPYTKTFSPLSQEQWDATVIEVSPTEKNSWKIEKGSQVSTWRITPQYKDDLLNTNGGEIPINVKATYIIGDEKGEGNSNGKILIKDISGFERFGIWFLKNIWCILGILALLALIIGYLPGVKSYFSKYIKPEAYVVMRNSNHIRRKLKKDLLFTIIPYVAQKATVNPNTTTKVIPTLKLKADKGGVIVMNMSSYIKRTGKIVRFDNEIIEPDTPNQRRFGNNLEIDVQEGNSKYRFCLTN
ncbi:MAG: hypothetical protein WCJ58_07970 [bacterium]